MTTTCHLIVEDLSLSQHLGVKKNRRITKNTVMIYVYTSVTAFVLTVQFLFLDDPYYCGLRARVPNFVSKSKTKEAVPSKRFSVSQQQGPPPQQIMLHPHNHMNTHSMHPRALWHARSYESGIGR